jgi:hypothetical protein
VNLVIEILKRLEIIEWFYNVFINIINSRRLYSLLLLNYYYFVINYFKLRPFYLKDSKILACFFSLKVFIFNKRLNKKRYWQFEISINLLIGLQLTLFDFNAIEISFAERELFISFIKSIRIKMEVKYINKRRIKFILFFEIQIKSSNFAFNMSLPQFKVFLFISQNINLNKVRIDIKEI